MFYPSDKPWRRYPLIINVLNNVCNLASSPASQLEESNRTLTVDVANLASEKEELNNQLKEMHQREFHFDNHG